MSGLAGILATDDRHVQAHEIQRLIGTLAHRAADGMSHAIQGCVAMGFACTRVSTLETAWEQPLVDMGGRTIVTFDGRIDNRDDLLRRLTLPAATPDAALVSAAYRVWGPEFPSHLLGDFALAVWDAREHVLFLARDVIGLRPLYYTSAGDDFRWASETRTLVEGRPVRLNESVIAQHIADRLTTTTETLYDGVAQVAPAHAMTVDARGRVRCWKYWEPAIRPLRLRDVREYDDAIWAALHDAVRVRLRGTAGATLSLSSGIDSGAIAAHVAALRDAGEADAARTQTLTLATDTGNEASRASLTAEWLKLPWREIPAASVSETELLDDAVRMRAFPQHPNSRIAAPLRSCASAHGRVLLYGLGSDIWLHGWHWTVADLLRRGRLVSAARWMRFIATSPDPEPIPGQLWLAAWTMTPLRTKRVLRRMLKRNPVPPWIEPAFASRTALADRIRAAQEHRWLGSYSATEMFAFGTSGEQIVRLSEFELLHAYAGLEMRCPFYDRRLIELALSLPADVRSTAGLPKAVLRRSAAAHLPPRVAAAAPDPPGDWSLVRVLEGLGFPRRIHALEAARRGWIDPQRTEETWQRWAAGGEGFGWPIWGMAAIDFWLHAESTVEASTAKEAMRDEGTSRRFGTS
jgi:asparagine synthase (glutamine-hydrolysing)